VEENAVLRDPSVRVEEATIDDLQTAMLAGGLRCRDLVEAYLRRIRAFDRAGPMLGAVVSVCEQAPERATELDAELARTGRLCGRLHGVPVLVKDCIETVDAPTTFGSIAFRDHRAREDAEVVRRLRAAGAVVLGKTTLCDFAAGWSSYSSLTGATKNPYALERDSGGSSAGSAAAVAANLTTVAVGTDCGGSIRVPASFCNLVGFRPTPGVVAQRGVLRLVAGQDTVGPLARGVADAARLLSVLADEGTPARAAALQYLSDGEVGVPGVAETRIGVVRAGFARQRPEMEAVTDVATRALEAVASGGASLVDVTIPDLPSWLADTSMYVLRSRHDIDAFLAPRAEMPFGGLGDLHARGLCDPRLDLIDAIVAGPDMGAAPAELMRRETAREAFAALLGQVMDRAGVDVLAYPSVQVPAPMHDPDPEWTTLTFPTNTLIASQAWMPAVSLPAGFTAEGAPVGIELLARRHDESRLLRSAGFVERATRQRRPSRHAPELAT
jgi:Asp-tRNA(Asn)/Glu-tRNA(Gln) amidotransferase A subunit family amidase